MGARPFYLDFLATTVNHLLLVRANAEYTMHNAVSAACGIAKGSATIKAGKRTHPPRLLNVAKGSILQGTLAKIALTCGDRTWGVDSIAASFTIKDALLKASTSARSQVVLTAEGGMIKVCASGLVDLGKAETGEWTPIKNTYEFTPTLQATCTDYDDRRLHSEHLLLNYLDHLIAEGKIQQQNSASGFLSIVSKRIPCCSCTRNIHEFLERNQWINLRLFYFYDTENRGTPDFLGECGNERIFALCKIALSSRVHLVEVEDDARLIFAEAAQEQQKMFGGAPNQIVSLVNPSQS